MAVQRWGLPLPRGEIAIYGTLREARQQFSARASLPELCISSAPSFLVSDRPRGLHARVSISLFGQVA